MRENNLYEPNIGKWRQTASRPVKKPSPDAARVAALEAENAALRQKLAASERTADTLRKAFTLVEGTSQSTDKPPR